MIIIIKDTKKWTWEDWCNKEKLVGLKAILGINVYEVINKQLFFLAVIKYGIIYEELKCSM
jgi:hypothetical protein